MDLKRITQNFDMRTSKGQSPALHVAGTSSPTHVRSSRISSLGLTPCVDQSGKRESSFWREASVGFHDRRRKSSNGQRWLCFSRAESVLIPALNLHASNS